ncbi:hypothetical protein KR026_001247 [Drosophila bipectinata]|nr:hypothetical protein KR026_001247 [Drosophila bipectinata]
MNPWIRGLIRWKGVRNQSRPYGAKKDSPRSNPVEQKTPRPFPSGGLLRSKKFYGCTIFLGTVFSAVLWAVYELGKPDEDHRGPLEDQFSHLPWLRQYVLRMWHSLQYYQKMVEEPLQGKLLPDVLPPPYIQPPYSLVLEIKDVLVHPDWTYQTGWRFKKRPGVDYFLQQCSRNFEIVVYTSEQGMMAFPLLDALDPYGYIKYRLVRGSTEVVEGQHIKNLDHLNRDLSRVIVVDCDAKATPLHPNNIFLMTQWLGNDDDVQLFDLTAFLQLLAEHQVTDVREVLQYYRQFDDPIEQFKDNQRRLQEQHQENEDSRVNNRNQRQWTLSLMGRSFRGS